MQMSDCLINPIRYPHEPEIKGRCLFFVNPGDGKFIAHEAKQKKAIPHSLFNSNLYEIPGGPPSFWAGPALGAPMAAMTLEKLIALGTDTVIVFGCCGSLDPDLLIGDLFIPTWGHSEEGVSPHYPCGEAPPATSLKLRAKLAAFCASKGHLVKEGPIWTTDAPFRETSQKIKMFGESGIMAVDMELSALASVALFRGIQLAALFVVSDELYHPDWRPGFQHKLFKSKSRQIFKELSQFTASIRK